MRKILALSLFAFCGACATTQPLGSVDAHTIAVQTIHDADAAGAAKAGGKPAELLAEAKSEATYAQHLPGDPEHAHRLDLMAEADAALAIVLARSQRYEHGLDETAVRHEMSLSSAAQ
jgi:hypothetical protein